LNPEMTSIPHSGPVHITDQGRPSHVLFTIEEYRQITGQQTNVVDLSAMPGTEEIEHSL